MPVSGAQSLPLSTAGEVKRGGAWLPASSGVPHPPVQGSQPAASPRSPALGVWMLPVTCPLLLQPPTFPDLSPRVLQDFGWATPGSRARRCVACLLASPLVCQHPEACPPVTVALRQWGTALPAPPVLILSSFFLSLSQGPPGVPGPPGPPGAPGLQVRGGEKNKGFRLQEDHVGMVAVLLVPAILLNVPVFWNGVEGAHWSPHLF